MSVKKTIKKKSLVKKTIKEKVTSKLNPKQEKFCQLYALNTKLFGNATMCYATAYGIDLDSLSDEAVYEDIPDGKGGVTQKKIDDSPYNKAHAVCRQSGYRLLTIVHINDRVNQLLRESLTDDEVDAEIAWVIKQREDLSPKMRGIQEYNKLKSRVKDKRELEITGLNLKTLYELASDNDDDE